MAQHDFSIANQTFPATRTDLNNALEALATLSSGATEPTTTYADMLWYDSGNNILKMRSEADDAWINVGYLCQSTNKFCILDDTNVVNTSGTQTGTIGDQATSAWEAGTSTTESLVSPAKVKAAVDNNQTDNRYESGWVAADYPATFTHGLGQTPQFYQLQARAAVANGGYSVDDVVMLLPHADGDGARRKSSYANSTQVVFPQAPTGGSPNNNLTNFSGSNWEIKMIALKELR